MSGFIQFIHQALEPLADTTRWTWLVIIVGALIVISSVSGFRALYWIFRGKGESNTIDSDDRSEKVIDIHVNDLKEFGSAVAALRSGDAIVVKTRKGRVRGILQRKTTDGQEGRITLSSKLASKLVDDDGVPSIQNTNVRLPWSYGPLHLWNHPDAGIQIGVRMAVVFLGIELFIGN